MLFLIYSKGSSFEDFTTSTPVKAATTKEEFTDPIAVLKKNVSDTLTFLHQERNDFLPEDDIIIPSRKDDHVSPPIQLNLSNLKKKTGEELKNVENIAENEVADVIMKAENVVNDLQDQDDSLDNLDSLRDDSITNAQEKSEAAFQFLENEIIDQHNEDSFIKSPNKSSIPVAKPRQKNDLELDDKISKACKVKTIKKHSKDPLKEFVKLTQDVNWDDDFLTENIAQTVTTTTVVDPIVKTTVTRITSEPTPKSRIPVLHTEPLSPTEIIETKYEISPKSKIPILKTETTRITSPDTTKSTIDSESDEDESPRETPPLKGILKKNSIRTVGSSSGSDVALHEEGAELSESETGMLTIF